MSKDNGIRTATYKGFTGSVDYTSEDGGVYFGKILDISEEIFYEATRLDDIQSAFEVAVDKYLEILFEDEKEK